jgi:UDP-N-acetyl-D-glucosamine dehydrogenase
MSDHSEELEKKILDRSARIGIIGLGYVGLPEAVMFAQAGFPVTGFDVDLERLSMVKTGRSYLSDVSSEVLASLVNAGRLRACHMHPTSSPADSGSSVALNSSRTPELNNALKDLDCLCICVPTPLRKTRDPDISFIVTAVQGFQKQLRPGQLVILESTTYPGTTEEVVQSMLEAGGLKAGSDFYLAFSPERVNPGDSLHPPASIPKVVGGVTPTCTRLAILLYEQVVTKVLAVSSPRAAEMVKLLENTFRSVNIGLVNELALMCDRFNLDVWEIIDAAASKPFGFMPFYPGPGLGGHCIPVDPFYLSWKARSNGFEARFIELAGQVNSYMPKHVVSKVVDALNDREQSIKGSRILIIGVAYKPDVSDTRESPALEIIRLLQSRGAYVHYHDPYVPTLNLDGITLTSLSLMGKSSITHSPNGVHGSRLPRPTHRSKAHSAVTSQSTNAPIHQLRPDPPVPAEGGPFADLDFRLPAPEKRRPALPSPPLVSAQPAGGGPRSCVPGFRSSDNEYPISRFDCVLIVTNHSGIDYSFLAKEAALIVDTRNATKDVPFARDKIITL